MPHRVHLVRREPTMNQTTYELFIGWGIPLSLSGILGLYLIQRIWGTK
jgi:hypothetical protein